MKLPRRLQALREHLEDRGDDRFGDWQLARAGSITVFYPDDEKEIVAAVEPEFHVFAGSFSGGRLALHLEGNDVERAPVVDFDSEGGIHVLAESFDDFLALIASDDPQVEDNGWRVEPDLAEWIASSGVQPHASVEERFAVYAEKTRRFWMRWTRSLGEASRRLRPSETVEHRLVLGESIAGARLGMPRLELDAVWGAPEIPAWGRDDEQVIAIHARAPFSLTLDPSGSIVRAVRFHKGRHRLVSEDGVEPMFMRSDDVIRWLMSRGFDAVRRGRDIVSPAAKLRLSVAWAYGGPPLEGGVEAVELFDPTTKRS